MAIARQAGQQAGPSPVPTPAGGGAAQPPGEEAAPPAESYPGSDLPDEQQDQQLSAFLNNAYTIIYGGNAPEGQINPEIAEALRSGSQNAQGVEGEQGSSHGAIQALAQTAATVGASVASSAMESGRQLDGPGVVLPGTLSLVEDLADVAVKEGIYDYSDEELASAVTLTGEQLFAQTQDLGLWNQEEFDAAVQQLIQMNQSGELDQAMPETAAAMGAMAGGGAPAEPPPGGQPPPT